ncbi:hypothetical protein FOXB_04727 [Fusarium oxysporum f. sp. conglutinans Fo5176]|uniref:Uncharacterized protein n=1 Tax=Fusarium oxysporum (strain Fo5176) TaxID=660025 RepID=F9FE99_FUSOF|nr:hypothetical protein FOXB_04727 [Fusarium oxysporum f. sp. conglutinans Fo5176]
MWHAGKRAAGRTTRQSRDNNSRENWSLVPGKTIASDNERKRPLMNSPHHRPESASDAGTEPGSPSPAQDHDVNSNTYKDGLIREAFIKMMRRKVHQHARHAPPAVRGTEQDLESCENQIATAHDVLTGAKASYDMAKAQKGEIQLKLEALLAEKIVVAGYSIGSGLQRGIWQGTVLEKLFREVVKPWGYELGQTVFCMPTRLHYCKK